MTTTTHTGKQYVPMCPESGAAAAAGWEENQNLTSQPRDNQRYLGVSRAENFEFGPRPTKQ